MDRIEEVYFSPFLSCPSYHPVIFLFLKPKKLMIN